MLSSILVIASLSGAPVPTLAPSMIRFPSRQACLSMGPRIVNSLRDQFGVIDQSYHDIPVISFECIDDPTIKGKE